MTPATPGGALERKFVERPTDVDPGSAAMDTMPPSVGTEGAMAPKHGREQGLDTLSGHPSGQRADRIA